MIQTYLVFERAKDESSDLQIKVHSKFMQYKKKITNTSNPIENTEKQMH